MKKLFILAGAVSMLFAGCAKQSPLASEGENVEVTVTAGLPSSQTRAVADYDGYAVKVNHWVMEIRDAQDSIFYREVRTTDEGTLQQSYKVTFIKGQTYNLLFWADNNGGYYNSDTLTNVHLADTVTYAANNDARDAFTAKKSYTANAAGTITAELRRPLAQLNIIVTDLPKIWEQARTQSDSTAIYAKFEPKNFITRVKVPTSFNVLTQTCGPASINAVAITAASSYIGYQSDSLTVRDTSNYYLKKNPATLFMDYVLASAGPEASLVDLEFSFKANSDSVGYSLSNIPLQANFRTNIKGELLSETDSIKVEIKPDWWGEYGIDN